MLTQLQIHGLRGFAERQTLRLAVPDGKSAGSGLTIIVGANNSGKSTAIEALKAVTHSQRPQSFTQGRRNHAAGDQIEILATGTNGRTTGLRSIRSGTSETQFERPQGGANIDRVVVIPSRRVFSPYFGKAEWNREQYIAGAELPVMRSSAIDQFTYRLFTIEKNKAAFNEILKRVVDPVPDWSIDQQDGGQYFVKVRRGTQFHSSEGMGEGLISLLFLVDALYDSQSGDTIAIDEPELSLHPALQRKLAALLVEYSSSRQIILATHSPYFVSMAALGQGGTIARVHSDAGASKLSQLQSTTAQLLQPFLENRNNPHILGLNAQEVFFMEDRVILVEGQEDVVYFKFVEESVGTSIKGNFYGWGVGGAGNMEAIAAVLLDLGFSKVVGVLDGDKRQQRQFLEAKYPTYKFVCLLANDIRTKPATPVRPEIQGLLDNTELVVRPEYLDGTRNMLDQINSYLA